jgi:hypothetical protein
MSIPIDDAEAQFALSSIEERRRQVIAEINVPRWYWLALAAGWVALGVIADYAPPWVDIAATLAFGAAHASIAPRVLSGRRASSQLSVRGELVDRRIPMLIIGLLVVMVAVTVVLALLLHADGARHPATWASVVVAALLLVAGPALMGTVRRRAERTHGR